MFTRNSLFVLFMAAVLGLGSASVSAQKKNRSIFIAPPEPEASAANLDQCRNGGVGETAVGCVSEGGNLGWVNGNAGPENAHWAEDQYLAYRMRITGVTTGAGNPHVLIIGYDIFKGSPHAIDYLGTYNKTETTANPCVGISGTHCAGGPAPQDTFPIPKDTVTVHGFNNPNTGLPIVQEDGVMSIWGGDITDIQYLTYGGGEDRKIAITFTADVANPVLAWSGHIAWLGDWGPGNSAGSIGGSPYHMRLESLDGSGGNQDRSLKSDAVIPSGAVVVIKKVESFNGDTADVFFNFDATASFNPLSFDLKDVNDSTLDRKISEAITLFGPANSFTVTEDTSPSFDLADVTCVESGANSLADSGLTNGDLLTRQATIIVQLGELVTCTFTNGLTRSTAAPASVSGRVTDYYGRSVSNARITVFNATSGEARSTTTNTFGYYKISDLAAGEFYVMNVAHRRYTFVSGSISFSLDADLTGMDFQASN